MQGQPVELLRRSVARTQAAGTATLRFVPSRGGGTTSFANTLADRGHGSGAAVLRLADRIVGRARSAAGVSEIGGRPGVADFAQERFLYDEGDEDTPSWTIVAPDEEYVGGSDRWERVDGDPQLLEQPNPAWLLALLAGVVGARRDGTESVLGRRSTRYRATIGVTEAAARGRRTLERPRTRADVDPDRLPCEVWLDEHDRIVKAVLHTGGSWVMMIELSEFGVPDPVQLPDPGTVWSADEAGQ